MRETLVFDRAVAAKREDARGSSRTRSRRAPTRAAAPMMVFAFVLQCSLGFGADAARARDADDGMTVPQLAAGIAKTIADFTPKPAPGAPITFQVTSHDNVIEMQYTTADPPTFTSVKSNIANLRNGLASNFCKPNRLVYLKRGIVIHETIVGPKDADRADFTIDAETCASLPQPVAADAATLAKLTDAIVQDAAAARKAATAGAPFRLQAATATNGAVEVLNIVRDDAIGQKIKANQRQFIGLTQGYLCGKYGDAIRQGVTFHEVYKLENGTPVLDYTIDSSTC